VKPLKTALAAVAGALILSGAALGEFGTWTGIGPGGGTVVFVAVAPSDPTVVYAATTEGGVFISHAGGVDWGSASIGITDLRTQCVVVSPVDPATAYAGTASGGFKTVNGGASWSALGGGFPSSVITSIVIDPSNPATMYAAGTSGSVVKSTNSGATWTDISASVAAAVPRILAIDPGTTSTLYLGTLDGGVYRSDDAGAHWAARSNGIENSHVTALAIDPTDPRRVYAGFSIGGTGIPVGGVYGSTDGGAHWTALNVGLDPTALVTALVVAADATVYVAGRTGIDLQMLAPGSSVWTAMPFPSSFPLSLAVGPGAAPPLFVGYGSPPFDPGGVTRWDGGAQYTGSAVNAGTVSTIVVDPATPGRALAGTPGGTYTYTAAAADPWSGLSTHAGVPSVFFFDTREPGTVYAGGVRGVWKSTDGGNADWAPAVNGLPDTQPPLVVRALAAVPGTPGGIFAGTSQGLFVTADGAATWSAGSADLAGKPIYSLAADPAATTTLWAGTDDGVYRSTNSGQTWSPAGSPLGAVVRALLIEPARVLAGTDAGLFSSGDGGGTWRQLAGGLPAAAVNALVDDAPGASVLAGTAAGVFASSDGGQTWTSTGGPANPNVLSLAVLSDGTVLAGTKGGSVYRSAPAAPPGADRGAVVRPAAPPSPRALPPRP
jgi:photosystem II stability/assembly factor-like uncharacterized protein